MNSACLPVPQEFVCSLVEGLINYCLNGCLHYQAELAVAMRQEQTKGCKSTSCAHLWEQALNFLSAQLGITSYIPISLSPLTRPFPEHTLHVRTHTHTHTPLIHYYVFYISPDYFWHPCTLPPSHFLSPSSGSHHHFSELFIAMI